MAIMTVPLTIDDIIRGKEYSCKECPVALALRRLFPGSTVDVAGPVSYLGDFQLTHTKVLSTAIIKFDKTREMMPGNIIVSSDTMTIDYEVLPEYEATHEETSY